MCGRFAYIPKKETLRLQFQVDELEEYPPRYNIPPGATVLVLCSPEVGQIKPLYLKWGLVPSWAKDKKIGGGLINARAETVFEKPAFKNSMKSKRGILVMSGFYEWRVENGLKQPYYFKQKNDEFLAIAALWDTWQGDNEVLHTCCLITTPANELMAPIHHRMPVILPKEHYGLWMDNATCHPEQLIDMMKPYVYSDIEYFPVTKEMNRVAFDVPIAIEPLSVAS